MDKIIFDELTWINIEDVTEKDTDYLREEFKVHPLDISDCLGAPQRPKIDLYDDYFFLVLRFPHFDAKKVIIRSSDLDIFVFKHVIITVQNKPITIVHDLFNGVKKGKIKTSKSSQRSSTLLLYFILNHLYQESLKVIDDLNRDISETEEKIYAYRTRQALGDLAIARRNNLNMRATVNPQRLVINTVAHIQKDWFNREGKHTLYFDDILDYLEKNWVILENQKEMITGLHETNESLMTYKTNSIITVLTIFSVSIMPLTLLSSFYGMNVDLPLQENTHSIWLIFLSFALFTIVSIYYVVTRRRWF